MVELSWQEVEEYNTEAANRTAEEEAEKPTHTCWKLGQHSLWCGVCGKRG